MEEEVRDDMIKRRIDELSESVGAIASDVLSIALILSGIFGLVFSAVSFVLLYKTKKYKFGKKED